MEHTIVEPSGEQDTSSTNLPPLGEASQQLSSSEYEEQDTITTTTLPPLGEASQQLSSSEYEEQDTITTTLPPLGEASQQLSSSGYEEQDTITTSLPPLAEDTFVEDERTSDSDDTLVAPGEFFTPCKRVQFNLVGNSVSASVQPEVAALYHLPTASVLLERFNNWLTTMDGGSYDKESSNKAKCIVANVIDSITIPNLLHANSLCKYFTEKQVRRELSASSTSIYLRHVSSFMLYLYQEYPETVSYGKYKEIETRIGRYVYIVIDKSRLARNFLVNSREPTINKFVFTKLYRY